MEVLFEQICKLSISSSWLILAVLAVRCLLRKSPKKYICALWLLVGIRLVFPFSIESVWSLVPAVDASVISEISNSAGESVEQEEQQVITGFNPYDYEVDNVHITTPVSQENQTLKQRTVMDVLENVWVIGVAVMLVYFFASFAYLKMKLSTAVHLKDNIRQSEYINTPFVFGIFKPQIYIPFHLSEESLNHVIAHEKIHISRKDHWTKAIAFLILSVYWFHPLVWIAYTLLGKDIEMACDEQVIAGMEQEQRKSYSLALLSCHGKRSWYYACPVGFGEVNVKERIMHILNYRKPAFWMSAAVMVLGVVISICFLTDMQKKEQIDTIQDEMGNEIQESSDVSQNPEETFDLGDMDGNGTSEYYTVIPSSTEAHSSFFTLYWNGQSIYEYDSVLKIMGVDAVLGDLDQDDRLEIFLKFWPMVNSMPLVEYMVLDDEQNGYKPLEMYHGEEMRDNDFPITMVYGEEPGTVNISCEGTATKLYIKGEALDAQAEWKLQDVNSGVYHTKTEDGIYDTYGDVSCLIATYTMDGLGNLQIYFNYDAEGKVNILDLQMNAEKILKTNPDHLITEIPKKNLRIYYDEWRDGRYYGIFIQKQVGEQTAGYSYDWEFDSYAADYNYPPEISLLHKDEHLLLHFIQGTGTGLFQTEAHILDLNTMKEIMIQSPEEFLAEAFVPLDKNVEAGEISFTHQGQFVSEVIPSDILAQENYTIGYGGWFQYGVEEDTLVYTTALQFGPIHYFGDLKLNYAWKDGQYQVVSTAYQSMGAY